MHTQPVTVPKCPRCKRPHKTVVARPLSSPVDGRYDAWAICPATLEPILVREYIFSAPDKVERMVAFA